MEFKEPWNQPSQPSHNGPHASQVVLDRQLRCKNNLKQLSLGCLNHEQLQSFFPAGGWGWAGDPDRGFNKRLAALTPTASR
jgi:hypothetical protein